MLLPLSYLGVVGSVTECRLLNSIIALISVNHAIQLH